MPDEVVAVLPGQLSIDDADPVTADEMLPPRTLPVVSEALSPAEVQSLEHYEKSLARASKPLSR